MMGASGAVRWESCNLTSKFYDGAKRIEVYVQKTAHTEAPKICRSSRFRTSQDSWRLFTPTKPSSTSEDIGG